MCLTNSTPETKRAHTVATGSTLYRKNQVSPADTTLVKLSYVDLVLHGENSHEIMCESWIVLTFSSYTM